MTHDLSLINLHFLEDTTESAIFCLIGVILYLYNPVTIYYIIYSISAVSSLSFCRISNKQSEVFSVMLITW